MMHRIRTSKLSRPDGTHWRALRLFLSSTQGGMMMTDVMTKTHQLIASDRVEGTAVRRPNGDKIGHIERLMIDKISGRCPTPFSVSAVSSAWEPTCCRCRGRVSRTIPNSRPMSSTSTMRSCGARRRSAPTRISIGAIARRRPNCIAITEYRLTGAGSDRGRRIPLENVRRGMPLRAPQQTAPPNLRREENRNCFR